MRSLFVIIILAALCCTACQKAYLPAINTLPPSLDTLAGRFQVSGTDNFWFPGTGSAADSVFHNFRFINKDTIVLSKISDTLLQAVLYDMGQTYTYDLRYASGCSDSNYCYTAFNYPQYSNSVMFYRYFRDSVEVYFSAYIGHADGYAMMCTGTRIN
jgi:hypothetical protein